VSALATFGAVLLAAAALHELWGARGEEAADALRRLGGRAQRSSTGRLLAASAAPRIAARIRAAGLQSRLEPRIVAAARLASALIVLPLTLSLAPAAPGRTAPLVLIAVPLAAAAGPDVVLERIGRRRRRRIAIALPAALELMAVRAETGAGPPRLLADARAALDPGPLHAELAGASAEIECGVPQAGTLARLGAEGGPELARLAVLVERSRRLGSPLAAGLQAQAAALRTEQGRAMAEDAARAAPKIQLVVALMLVPSVLLLVGAAIAANAESLLSGLA